MKKVAIFLPVYYLGGTLRAAKNLAKSIKLQAERQGSAVEVIFSCIKDVYDIPMHFDDLIEMDIKIRETYWKLYSSDELKLLNDIMEIDVKIDYPTYCMPKDGANDFLDCDFWIIISDRLLAPIYPIRPHCIMVYDYIQRYVPEIFGNNDGMWAYNDILIQSVRSADYVLCTTPATYQDIISYAGIDRDKVKQLPMDFEPIQSKERFSAKYKKNNYFVWVTNGGYHKNQIRAINSLIKYYEKMDGNLKVVITGFNSDLFDFKNKSELINMLSDYEREYINKVRKIIKDNPILHKNISFVGNVSDLEYADILNNAKFLWHTNLSDNGTFSVIEAAYLGKPSLASNYPAMKFIDKRFGINLTFFNPYDVNEMARALKEMEKDYMNKKLPSVEKLEEFTWVKQSEEIYKVIEKLIKEGERNRR